MICCLAYIHYFSSPGRLSWSGILKMTAVKLIFVSDTDMYQFTEEGLKGGARYIALKYRYIDK